MLEQSQDFKSPLIYICMYVCMYVYIYFFSPPPSHRTLKRAWSWENLFWKQRGGSAATLGTASFRAALWHFVLFILSPTASTRASRYPMAITDKSNISETLANVFWDVSCNAVMQTFNCCPLQPGFSVFQLLFKNQFFCLIIYSLLKLSRLQMKESLHPRRLTYFGCVVGVQDIFLELLKVLRI